MPSIFEISGYKVYFWSNEQEPLEPVHVHISKIPHRNATKVWILSSGKCMLANDTGEVPPTVLSRIMRMLELPEANAKIQQRWQEIFNDISFYDEANH